MPVHTEVEDPLDSLSGENEHWTTANMGEAMPGVATPLSATVWGDSVDRGLIAGAHALGAIAGSERETLGPPGDRLIRMFRGRSAVKADFLALVGDRMPGTSGEEVVRAFFGEVPETMSFHPTARRYPFVAVRLPSAFAAQPRRVRALAASYDGWWTASIRASESWDEASARHALREARESFERAVIVQSVAVMTCVQPVYEALAQTVRDVGAGDLSVLSSPPGGAESAVVRDIWRASRGQIGVPDVVARHGFHGPFEGELSSRVWREDPSPLERMVEQYAGLGEDQEPAAREAALSEVREMEEGELLAAASAARRPAIRLVLRLVRTRIPLRGVAKRSMLQSLDVTRAAARALGSGLAGAGRLDDADDIFFLTLAEALAPPSEDLGEIAASRRARREDHARVEIPEAWRGTPPEAPVPEPGQERARLVTGEGVSTGVAEGTARVVEDPAFTEVEPGEILVAPTTDPSWSSIMFVSSALVVDIGGALSHAAVVARELGIPCVVNTRSGSRTLRTGDRVRVDGNAGTIEVLGGRMSFDDWDPLNNDSPDDLFWTITNAGEAMPGVQTPLSISAWKDLATVGFQKAGEAFGVFTEEDGMPCLGLEIFYGRGAMSVTFLGVLGDRAPGTTGEQAVRGLLGHVPEGMTFSPTRRYYLNVLRHYPRTFLAVPRRLRDLSRRQDEWWRSRVIGSERLDEPQTRRLLDEAFERHAEATITQCVAVFNAVQPVHDAVEQLIDKLGVGDKSKLTAPVGGAEMEVVADIWRASRGELTVEDVVGRHGFHGPVEGEIASRVWRDDDTPLRKLVDQYGRRPDSDSPLASDAERIRERERAERELLEAAPRHMRPPARLVLSLARKRLHLRGVAKRSMLQGFDGIRASARRLGHLLAADGAFDDPEDVFYLTTEEIRRPLPRDVKDLVARRRQRRAEYARYTLPTNFSGVPTPIPIEADQPQSPDDGTVEGIGVSSGVVEGTARVVTDPGFADVEDDEILVAPTTDPSWSSIMFLSSALVVDIGGALSHAAVVARELGIPCVVNTRNGTAAIRTGDRVRVDGGAGTVEILERAKELSP